LEQVRKLEAQATHLKSISTGLTFLLAAILGVVTTWIFFPGLMSFDSIFQYRQVIGDIPIRNYHPPVMVYTWKLGHALLGPGSMLVFHQAIYWLAIALIAVCLRPEWQVRWVIVFVLGLLPPLWIHSATVWNDVGVMSAFLLAVACSLLVRKTGSWPVLVLGVAALLYGLLAKRTGLLAAIPLFFLLSDAWFSARLPGGRPGISQWRKVTAMALGLWLSALGVSFVIGTVGVEKMTKWPTVALWDLAAVSLAENQVLIPAAVLNHQNEPEAETLARLREAFSPAVNGPLVNVVNLFPEEADLQELFAAWLALPRNYPVSYLGHRVQVFGRLLGIYPYPVHFAFEHRIFPNDHGLQLANGDSKPFYFAIKWVGRSVNTLLYKSWFYLSLLLAVWVFALVRLFRFHSDDGRVLVYLGLSGLMYVAPLFLVAPAADFRYTLWMVACAAVMVCFIACRE